jgi:hypothetical protein
VGLVVVAILRGEDSTALEAALARGGFEVAALQVLRPDESSRGIELALDEPRLLTSSGAVRVPGINEERSEIELSEAAPLADRLSELEIPDGEIDGYLRALEAGNSVVAYFAKPSTVERVVELFRAAGLAQVTRY